VAAEGNANLADANALPVEGASQDDLIYVGFWLRLAAYAIDIAIVLPLALLTKNVIYISRSAYLADLIVGTLIAILFEVYLVKRFGGSPGKIILKIRIAKLDGSPVGYREACIRYSVLFLFNLLTSAALLMSLFNMTDVEYGAFAAAKTSIRSLEASTPVWYGPLQLAGAIWVYSEFIVLLTNKKRRALHDFMAGTVVVRTPTKPGTGK
jgi:uncharacterized RDD family membrane protein YckC